MERAIDRTEPHVVGPDRDALEALSAFDTFAEAEDHGVCVPTGLTADGLCLTARSSAAAAAAFARCRRAADAADVLLTNHALVLTDCRYRGGVLGIGGTVRTVLFDEADMLPEVARSVADEQFGLDGLAEHATALGAEAKAACRALERLCGARDRTRRAPAARALRRARRHRGAGGATRRGARGDRVR